MSPALKESLNGNSTIHINMLDATGCELRWDCGQRPGNAHHRSIQEQRHRASAEHEDRLLAVGPGVKSQYRLVRLAPNDHRIHRGHELVVAVGFAAARWEKIEAAVPSGDETVKAGTNKEREYNCALHLFSTNG